MTVHKSSELLVNRANIIDSIDTPVRLIRHTMRDKAISRHDLGMSVIHAIGSDGFAQLSAALDMLDPDFRRLLIEGAYADIIARPNLALKHRELITVAVLTVMGNTEATLKYHAGGMLNTGWAPQAVLATVWLTRRYAGMPVAMAGLRNVFMLLRAHGVDAGFDACTAASCDATVARMLDDPEQPLDALTPKERALATLAIVIALENRHDAVRRHLNACLRLGWTRSELTEVLIQLTGYLGWPLVLPVTRIALDVLGDIERRAASNDAGMCCTPDTPDDLDGIPPELARYLDASHAPASRHGEALDRAKARLLTAIACLTCLSRNADADALVMHMREALSLGASRDEIVDAIAGALPYAGVPAAQSALAEAERLFASTGSHPAAERENAAA
ncbi:carboxymuconolactone decarboxylase family protein [Burkholderia vietnamiensis]|uniref:Carboxymuconolactone decarboxylase family protein n=3 Tax=Burkholderia vietnamiensis TaxID=60552 RepID=A0AAW7T7X1_BURVI|nr:carboxymuconolactone decarboxylase family protein [Burkholderia vietnamiensis]MDN7797694.1 carboxymuconolactone decarboxylase family protein [Burkholderia vietnamiensis]UEB99058.1 carboxymuconolactone decarboxylase family protein [Burkholderia vietnamiensis]UKV73912.1 carboxymuconolactone decarboxylase family protein [Burkholderia vietnamiensis]